MHIEKLEIHGFGKIEKKTIPLIPGMNVFYGENESGKSTLQWFIKAMLFGLKGGRLSKDGVLPPLKRFKPWNGKTYGGLLEYRLKDGSLYRVERNFDDGSVRIYDANFNDLRSCFDLGRDKELRFAERHLGVNEACFDRTVFVRQLDLKIDEDGRQELVNRLVNASGTGLEDLSFKKACKALREAMKTYIGTDRTTTRPLDMVNERLRELKSLRESLILKRASFLKTELLLKEAMLTKKKLEGARDYLASAEKAVQLKKDLVTHQFAVEQLTSTLLEIAALKDEINQYSGCLEKDRSRRSAPGNRAIADALTSIRVKVRLASVLGGIFLAFALFSAGYGLLADGLWIKAAFCAAIPAGIGFVAQGVLRKKMDRLKAAFNENDKQDALNREAVQKVLDLNNRLMRALGKASLACHKKLDSEEQVKEALLEEEINAGSLKKRLGESLDALDQSEQFPAYTPAGFSSSRLRQDGLLTEELSAIEAALKGDYQRVCGELTANSLEIREYETLLTSTAGDDESIQRIDEELQALGVKKERLEDTDASLQLALSVLEEAGLEIQKDFVPLLDRKISHMLDWVSGGRYRELKTDDSLFIKAVAPETGAVTGLPTLSGGTVDQAYLAMRLAMADLMCADGETLPLIMDEVFVQYDDVRTGKTLQYLKENCGDRQIILFTCKSREVDIAASVFGADINIIRL